MPVEQVRRKREVTVTNRRTNALKHQHSQPGSQTNHPPVGKDLFGTAKSGHVNGVNVIGLSTQNSASPSNQPTSTSMSSKAAIVCSGSQSLNPTGSNQFI